MQKIFLFMLMMGMLSNPILARSENDSSGYFWVTMTNKYIACLSVAATDEESQQENNPEEEEEEPDCD